MVRELTKLPINYTTAKELNSQLLQNDTYHKLRSLLIDEYNNYALYKYSQIDSLVIYESSDSNPNGSYFSEFSVKIISPIDGTNISGVVQISFYVTEHSSYCYAYGVVNVSLYLNDSLIATLEEIKGSSNTFYWDTSTISDGNYTLKVIAIDYDGKVVYDIISTPNSIGSQARDNNGNNLFDYNYWNDHTGLDDGNDDIVDDSYKISDNNSDKHPLTKPVNQANPPLIISNTTTTDDANNDDTNSFESDRVSPSWSIVMFILSGIIIGLVRITRRE